MGGVDERAAGRAGSGGPGIPVESAGSGSGSVSGSGSERGPGRGRTWFLKARYPVAVLVVVAAPAFAWLDHDRRAERRVDPKHVPVTALSGPLCDGKLPVADAMAFERVAGAGKVVATSSGDSSAAAPDFNCRIINLPGSTTEVLDLEFSVSRATGKSGVWQADTSPDAVPIGPGITGMTGAAYAWALVPCPGQPSDVLLATADLAKKQSDYDTWERRLPADERAALARAVVRIGNAVARQVGCAAEPLPEPARPTYPDNPVAGRPVGADPACAAVRPRGDVRESRVVSSSVRPAPVEQCSWSSAADLVSGKKVNIRFITVRGTAATLLPADSSVRRPNDTEAQVARTDGRCGTEPVVWMTRVGRLGPQPTPAETADGRAQHELLVAAAVSGGCTVVAS